MKSINETLSNKLRDLLDAQLAVCADNIPDPAQVTEAFHLGEAAAAQQRRV